MQDAQPDIGLLASQNAKKAWVDSSMLNEGRREQVLGWLISRFTSVSLRDEWLFASIANRLQYPVPEPRMVWSQHFLPLRLLFLQRLPLRLLFLQRLALRLLFLQRAALRLLLLLRLLSIRTSTTSATAILWLRACSGHSLSLSLLFLCNHTTGSLSAHSTGSGLPLSDGKT